METKIVEKNKYIIYNSDDKILTFSSDSSRMNMDIRYPRVILGNTILDSNDIFYKSIIDLLVDEDKSVLLDQFTYNSPIFKSENNKLKKQLYI